MVRCRVLKDILEHQKVSLGLFDKNKTTATCFGLPFSPDLPSSWWPCAAPRISYCPSWDYPDPASSS